MSSAQTSCQTCGTGLSSQLPGLGAVCPACVVRGAQNPSAPVTQSDDATDTATWGDVFPQLEILETLRDDSDCPVYRVALLGHRHREHGVLQIVSGAAWQRAGGAIPLQTRAQRLAVCEIDGVATVLDHGDLADAYFLLTEAPKTSLSIPRAIAGRQRDEVVTILNTVYAQAEASIGTKTARRLELRFDPELAFFDEVSGRQLLTPTLLESETGSSDSQSAREASEPGDGSQLGPFTLMTKVGEGGFGQVWRVRQTSPVRRDVALKILKAGFHSRHARTRFKVEQQALARLKHPHIAAFIAGGATENGRPYFAMEWIEGVSIARHCHDHKARLEVRLALFKQVCQAIQHAHQKGIIHRDLKSSNVMVSAAKGTGDEGDSPSVRVIDFGIARSLTESLADGTLLTRADEVLGTPAWMSPEQARGPLALG